MLDEKEKVEEELIQLDTIFKKTIQVKNNALDG
jgi:hypothetical protein